MIGGRIKDGRWRWLALAVALAAPAAARAQTVGSYRQASLPLGEALERFGRQSGFDIVYPESLVRGLRSGMVEPTASPHRALEALLKGTGLAARFTRPDAIILEPVRTADAPDMVLDRLQARAPTRGQAAAYQWYGQRLLEASLGRLRDSSGLVARSYDLFVYLWVDEQGSVTDTRVYSGNGEQREAGLAATILKDIALRLPPPADMPQPVGIRVAAQ
jgi:hypothetical protein